MSTRVEPHVDRHPAEPAVAPPPGSPRFPLIDGMRAIAAISILVTHTAGLSGFNGVNVLGAWTARLDSGVAIFFVLSGFLLYRPWVAARMEGRPGPRPLVYAKRRALRILPGYWFALTVLGLVLPKQVPYVFSGDWWVYFGLLQSWQSDTILFGIGVAWSLSVEAAFYVLLPLLAWGTTRWLRGRRHQVRLELWALGLSAVLAVAVRTWIKSQGGFSTYGNTLPGMWTWFAAGMALAVLSAAYGKLPLAERPALLRSATEHPLRWWAVAFAALTTTAWGLGLPRVFGQPYTTLNLQQEHLLYCLAAVALVAPAVFSDGRRTAVARLLDARPVAWLGLVSYGIFLYHLPLTTKLLPVSDWAPQGGFFLYTACTLALATLLAAVSYHLVERPALRFK